MANLFNKYIYETYKSIVGIGQSGTSGLIPGTIQPLTDGEGNELPIRVSDTDVEVDYLTSKNLFIEAYGEVVDQNGNWVGPTQGLSGTSGTSGTSGATGTSGTSGVNGSSGQTGSAGTSGTSGIGSSGTSGTAGTSGIGSSGTSGTNGATGSSGTSGQNGTSGTSGQNGTSGANGTSGTSGISEPGTPGTSGTSGTAGTSGTSGSNGVSSGRVYYFNNSMSSDVIPYKVLDDEPTLGSLQTIIKNLAGNETGVLVQEFLTPQFGFTVIPSGVQRFHFHALKPQENDDIQIYATLQLANSNGIGYSPIYQTAANVINWNDAVTPSETIVDIIFPQTAVGLTDRMIVKVYLSNYVSTAKIVQWYTEDGEYSYVNTSVSAASGTSGTSGTSGVDGAVGSSGTSGQNGTSGTDGNNGTSGTSGVDGSGTSGTSGIDGPQGPAGTSGTSGTSGGGSSVSTYNSFGTGVGSTTGNDGPYTFFTNIALTFPVYAIAGNKLSSIDYQIKTAFTTGAASIAIYDSQPLNPAYSKTTYGELVARTRLTDIVSCPNNTTGFKTVDVTSLNFVFPYTGIYFLGFNVPGIWDGAMQASQTLAFNSAINTGLISGNYMNTTQTDIYARVGRATGPLPTTFSDIPSTSPSSATSCILLKTTI